MSPAQAPDAPAGATGGPSAVPRHVAIIMDGNGRWAERRRLPRVAGHRAGAEAVRKAMQSAADLGVGLVRLEQRRHRMAELFLTPAGASSGA